MQNSHGQWVDWNSGLHATIASYFNELFSSSSCQTDTINEGLPVVIIDEINHRLMSEMDIEEVKAAIFQMHLDKASGPDDFSPCFFQKHGDVIGQDVFRMFCQFFQNGEFLNNLDATYLVLIAKISKPKTMKDLRPIALCNVLYKFISKCSLTE